MILMIKGRRDQVRDALIEHGFNHRLAILKKEAVDGSIVEIDDVYQEGASNWYNETVGAPPYPPGTLLFFNVKDKSAKAYKFLKDVQKQGNFGWDDMLYIAMTDRFVLYGVCGAMRRVTEKEAALYRTRLASPVPPRSLDYPSLELPHAERRHVL